MDVEGYNKLNKRAKEIAFRKALDAIQKHVWDAQELCYGENIAVDTHLRNADNEIIDLRAMALFAKFQDNKKWWMFWRK